MSNVVYSNTYKLKDGASVPEFLLAIEALMEMYISKQEGYISSRLLSSDDGWTDSVTFATMDNLDAFLENAKKGGNELANKFYSFLNFATCKTTVYTVEMNF
jgi:hypothetical protein